MTERRATRGRRGSSDSRNTNTNSERPHSGIFGMMWNKMAEYLEMRTFHDWSDDDGGSEDSSSSVSLEEDGKNGDSPNKISNQNMTSNVFTTTTINKKTTAKSVVTQHSKVLSSTSSTSSANESYSRADSGFESKSSSTSSFYSYASSTVSSNSSYSSFREEDYDFVDTMTFQEFDEEYGEQQYKEMELGEGHSFEPTRLFHVVTWCDKCGEIIWGFHKLCLRCSSKYEY